MSGDGLTDAAKKELHEAIAIIREDRFEKFARARLGAKPPTDPKPTDPPKPNDPPAPPPPNPNDPPTDPPPVDKHAYWGELLN